MEMQPTANNEEQPFYLKPVVLVPLVVVMLALLAFAVVIVVMNVGRVRVGPSPVGPRGRIPEVILLERFREKTGIRYRQLSLRYDGVRQLVTTPTAQQDSLLRVCDSGFSRIGHLIAVFDSLEDLKLKRAVSDTIKEELSKLREKVNQFVKLTTPEPSLDSLDREFEELQRY